MTYGDPIEPDNQPTTKVPTSLPRENDIFIQGTSSEAQADYSQKSDAISSWERRERYKKRERKKERRRFNTD